MLDDGYFGDDRLRELIATSAGFNSWNRESVDKFRLASRVSARKENFKRLCLPISCREKLPFKGMSEKNRCRSEAPQSMCPRETGLPSEITRIYGRIFVRGLRPRFVKNLHRLTFARPLLSSLFHSRWFFFFACRSFSLSQWSETKKRESGESRHEKNWMTYRRSRVCSVSSRQSRGWVERFFRQDSEYLWQPCRLKLNSASSEHICSPGYMAKQ